jgi:excisionase family DNA binding protein
MALWSVRMVSSVSRISRQSAKLQAMKSTAKSTARTPQVASSALTFNIEIDPLMAVVRRHVKLSPQLSKRITNDFALLLQNPRLISHTKQAKQVRGAGLDSVISTQQAADLVSVSRPYIVARIEAGDIPLHQQVGNQRRVLQSHVLAWHKREQARHRKALGQLGLQLDAEIFGK